MDESLVAFQRDLDDLGHGLSDVEPATEKATELIARAAKARARRRTGYMADHIEARGAQVEAEAPYSVFVHEGLANIPTPNPFFDEAIATGDYLQPFEEHIEEQLHRQLRSRY